MGRSARLASVVWLLVLVVGMGCRGMHGSPDGRDAPYATAALDFEAPTPEDVAHAVIDLGQPIGSITLSGGTWTDAAAARQVRLVTDVELVGDLLQDGDEEAVALVVASHDGVETLHAVVLDVRDGVTHQLAAAPIGTGLKLRRAAVENHGVVLDVLGPGPGDEPCCPTAPRRVLLTLRDHTLVVSDVAMPPAVPR